MGTHCSRLLEDEGGLLQGLQHNTIQRVNALQHWPWRKIISGVAVSLILVGLAPVAYLEWWDSAHNIEPLVFPLSLKRGTFTSPSFQTDLEDDYQVELYFVPNDRSRLDLDWKIVDESGAAIRKGSYREDRPTGGNDVILERHYRPKLGSRQRAIVTILHDVEASDPNTSLHVGIPERGLADSYAIPLAITWAAVVAGIGGVMLLFVAIQRMTRREVP